jgi:hypothetical protein
MSKLINTIFKVDACQDCPLHVFPNEISGHDCRGSEKELVYTEKDERVFYNTRFIHPECPLKSGKIMVELKKE